MQAVFGRDAQLTRSGLVVGCPPPDGLRPQGFTPVLLCTPDPTLLWSPRHCPVCSLLLGVCFVLGPDSFQLITLIMLLRDFVNGFVPGWIYRQPIIWDDLLPPAPPSHLPSPGRAHGRHPHHRADAIQQVVQWTCTWYFWLPFLKICSGFGRIWPWIYRAPGSWGSWHYQSENLITHWVPKVMAYQRWHSAFRNHLLHYHCNSSSIMSKVVKHGTTCTGAVAPVPPALARFTITVGRGRFLHMLQHYCQVSWRCVRTGWVCRWQGDSSSILFWNRNVKISSFSCWPWR